MNKARRKRIETLVAQISDLVAEIESVADEEREAMGNMPESLWESERYAEMETAIDALDEVVEQMQSAASALEEVGP
jgi:exonuclease VII small subunit